MKLRERIWLWLNPVELEEAQLVKTGLQKATFASRINAVRLQHSGTTGTSGIHEVKHALKDKNAQGGEMGMRLHRNRIFPRKLFFVTWYQSHGPRGIEEQIKSLEAPGNLMSSSDKRTVRRLSKFL